MDTPSKAIIGYAFLGFYTLIIGLSGVASILLSSPLPVLFGVFWVVVATPLTVSIHQSRFDIFEPVVFKSVFIGMVGVLLLDRSIFSQNSWQYDVIGYSLEEGVIVLLIGYTILFGSILAGYYTADRYIEFNLLSKFPPIHQINTKLIRRFGYIYIIIGLIGWGGYVLTAFGGDPMYMFQSGRPRSWVGTGSEHFAVLITGLPLGYLLCLSAAIEGRKTIPISWIVPIPIIFSVLFTLGDRGKTISFVLMVLIIVYYGLRFGLFSETSIYRRAYEQTPKLIRMVVLPVIGILVGMGLIVARGLRLGQSPVEAVQAINPVSLLTFGIHDSLPDNFLALTEIMPSEIGFYYGALFTRPVTNFIPRAFWEGKPPLSVGAVLRRQIQPDAAGGLPPGEIGYYYANFGWAGIIMLSFLAGVFLQALYQFLHLNRRSPYAIAGFAIIISILVPGSGVNNTSLQSLAEFILFIGPLVVVHIIWTFIYD